MASNTGTLYVGVTNNLIRRVHEHKNKLIRGFTQKYNITNLVFFQEYKLIEEAILMEKTIKGWTRNKKLSLIKSVNPNFQDLSAQF